MKELNYLTDSALLLLPLILDSDELIQTDMFINAYSESMDYPWFERHIFMLFKTSSVAEAIRLDDLLSRNSNLLTKYSIRIDGEWYNLAIFVVPMKYYGDYKCLLHNSSNTDIRYIQKIIKLWRNIKYVTIEDHLHEIIYPFKKTKDIVPLKDVIPEIEIPT